MCRRKGQERPSGLVGAVLEGLVAGAGRGMADAFAQASVVSPPLFRKTSGRKDPAPTLWPCTQWGETPGSEERGVSRTKSDGEASSGH